MAAYVTQETLREINKLLLFASFMSAPQSFRTFSPTTNKLRPPTADEEIGQETSAG